LAELEKKQSFWTTLPGMMTGIAALLTAVTGLLVVMHPHGPAGGKESPGAGISSGVATPRATPAAGGGSSASPAPSMQQRQKPTVLVVGKDGTETRVFLNGFKDSYTDEAIGLKSGQSIPFDKIGSIDFLDVHEYQRDVKVTLRDGRTLEGAIQSGEQFRGETDIGPFAISVVNLKRIAFER
jgi:hypothetical protein